MGTLVTHSRISLLAALTKVLEAVVTNQISTRRSYEQALSVLVEKMHDT